MRGLAALLLFLWTLSPAVAAQEEVIVHMQSERQVTSTRFAHFGGSRTGGLGFLLVDLENLDDRPHEIDVVAATSPWSSGDQSTRRAMQLGPRERAKFFLPWANTAVGSFMVEVTVDGSMIGTHVSPGTNAGLCGLLVTERTDRQAWGTLVVQAMPSTASDPPTVLPARLEHLPADWRLFTAFDAVVVDGRCRMAAEQQEALRRFVFAGGTVVVGEPDRLPAGPLRDLAAKGGSHGLGHCVVVDAGGGDTGALRATLGALPRAGLGGWPAPPALQQQQEVPGLGAAPAKVFLVVILAFAVLAGPVNFLLLRRWRRPLLVLVTVPALGLGTTLVMLGYGLLHDGLGIRGVVRSWTLLDQERHEAAGLAARTLFCGTSPSSLDMGTDGLLVAPRASDHQDRTDPDRWHFDGANGQLDGGALPSRRVTPLLSAQQGVVRQRLRFRALDADRFEVLADGGVEPQGEIVLRDFDGAWWVGDGKGLQRASAEVGSAALDRFGREAGVVPMAPGELVRFGLGSGEIAAAGGPQSVHPMLARFLGNEGLRRGSYTAIVRSAPWLDEHGMQVAYDMATHFVIGRLAAEDFVR